MQKRLSPVLIVAPVRGMIAGWRRSLKRLVVILLLLGFGVAFYFYYFSDKKVIERTLKHAAHSVEKKQLRGAVSVFARTYKDPYGHDYEWVAGMLHTLLQNFDDIRITFSITAYAIEKDRASISVEFKASGTQEGKRTWIVGSGDENGRAVLEMEKIRGDWQIVSTSELQVPGVDIEKL
jgi:hypothetical protein